MEEKKHTILYVDDEANNLTAFVASFRRFYTIHTATSAKEGAEIMRKTDIELIITDQRMPDMTGVQFLEAITHEYPQTVNMILTGFTDIEAIIKAINSGRVFRYITKPWDVNELKISIDSGLKLFGLEKEKNILLEKLQHEVQKQQRIVEMFQKYVPKKIVAEVLDSTNHESILAGEHRIISAMFADIRHFTTIAEKLGPEKTVQFLNDYYALMAEKVEKHHGTINRYLGDGLLVLFGAPISHMFNQLNATLCGLEMLESVKELNEKYEEMAGQPIAMGIGIHTGDVLVGNIGTQDHVEYTAIGDTVNAAERIQELSRNIPNTLLISDATYQIIKNDVEVEELGLQSIRGKEEQIAIYKVTGKKL